MSINNSKKRIGRFTSSQIYRLCATNKNDTIAKAFYTYVEEVYLTRKMGRSVNTEVKTQPMKWGSLMEVVLFNKIGLNYKMAHKSTLEHPEHGDFWSGTPDLIEKGVKHGEIKAFQPKHFAQLSLALLSENTEVIKEKEKEVYWQAVSNALILGVEKAEIIAYMPYKSELEQIIDDVENSNFLERNGLDPTDYYFLSTANIESLPYLPDDSPMSSINMFEFEVPKHDVEFLTERVLLANKEFQKLLK